MTIVQHLKISVLALALYVIAPPARAQEVVLDPSNLAQNLLQAARALQQINHQIEQIEQQARMLARSPLQMSDELTAALNEAEALFSTASQLSFEVGRVSEELRQLYPETWEAFQLGDVSAQSERWLAQSRASIEAAMAAQARAPDLLERQRSRIDRALSASADAEGQTSAAQAGNQLLGVQASALAEIHALLAAQGRALEVERLERLTRDQRADEIRRRAFPTRTEATQPARTAF